MPNLDNVFNKFFPKSKTAPMGKKLIYFAWGIEILVALVGLTMAMLFFFSKGQSGAETGTLEIGKNLDNYIVGLAFIVVAIMELTKIPLATACYYAAKWTWRTIFIVALIAVNYSTFETIIQGFELGYHNRLAIVDIELEKKEKIIKEIEDLNNNNLNKSDENKKINDEINELERQKAVVESQKIDAINNIIKQHSSSNNEVLIKLEENKESKKIDRKEKEESLIPLQNNIIKLEADKVSCNEKGWRKERDACKAAKQEIIEGIQLSITKIRNDISNLDKDINTLGNKISELASKIDGDVQPLVEAEENKASIAKERIQKLIDQKIAELGKIQSGSSSENYLDDLEILNKKLTEQQEVYVKTARQNQIYRIAKFIKNTGSNFSAWWNNKPAKKYTLNDIDQSDTDLAFMLWFGGLALVISIIGTLVALAGLHLQDERMHEIRNKPIKARLGRFFRNIAWIPVYINKYIWAGVKRLKDPKIVKEKVEVEVEKIIEKPIFKDKVVYVDQEVPRETIIEKKEMVYVPLPTDDEELLKKGPFKAPDYDKDKKK